MLPTSNVLGGQCGAVGGEDGGGGEQCECGGRPQQECSGGKDISSSTLQEVSD